MITEDMVREGIRNGSVRFVKGAQAGKQAVRLHAFVLSRAKAHGKAPFQ